MPSASSSICSSAASCWSRCWFASILRRQHPRHAGEFFALVLFGAVGMLLMTSLVELLMVFIGLEISSISTYIMAGFRKRTGGVRSGDQILPAWLVCDGVFPVRHRAHLRRDRHHAIAAIAAAAATTPHSDARLTAVGHDSHRAWLQGLRRALPRLDARRLSGRSFARRRLMSTAPKAAAFAVLLRIIFCGLPRHPTALGGADLDSSPRSR